MARFIGILLVFTRYFRAESHRRARRIATSLRGRRAGNRAMAPEPEPEPNLGLEPGTEPVESEYAIRASIPTYNLDRLIEIFIIENLDYLIDIDDPDDYSKSDFVNALDRYIHNYIRTNLNISARTDGPRYAQAYDDIIHASQIFMDEIYRELARQNLNPVAFSNLENILDFMVGLEGHIIDSQTPFIRSDANFDQGGRAKTILLELVSLSEEHLDYLSRVDELLNRLNELIHLYIPNVRGQVRQYLQDNLERLRFYEILRTINLTDKPDDWPYRASEEWALFILDKFDQLPRRRYSAV